jgi:hypothetical protein
VTLKDAIISVNQEWANEVSPKLTDADHVAVVVAEMKDQDKEVMESMIPTVLLALARRMQTPAEEFVSVCIRFGMRVQRKLDHPEWKTTTYCRRVVESVEGPGTVPATKSVLN